MSPKVAGHEDFFICRCICGDAEPAVSGIPAWAVSPLRNAAPGVR